MPNTCFLISSFCFSFLKIFDFLKARLFFGPSFFLVKVFSHSQRIFLDLSVILLTNISDRSLYPIKTDFIFLPQPIAFILPPCFSHSDLHFDLSEESDYHNFNTLYSPYQQTFAPWNMRFITSQVSFYIVWFLISHTNPPVFKFSFQVNCIYFVSSPHFHMFSLQPYSFASKQRFLFPDNIEAKPNN